MSVADLLRHERERRSVTLKQLSDETKIPLTRLAALENAQLRPDGGFYHRAQLRACAHALNLDERVVLDELHRDLIPTLPLPVPQQPETRRRHRAHLSPAVVAFGCVVAAVAAGIALLKHEPQQVSAVRDREPQPMRAGQESGPSPAVASPTAATAGTVEPGAATARTDERLPTSPGVPASAPAPVTQLIVTSQPAGARVTVDGIGWGVTPVTIRHLSEGLKRVRLTTDGYVAAERLIQVDPDRTTRVSIELRASPSPIQSAP